MPINSKYMVFGGVLNFNCPVGEHFHQNGWIDPSILKFFREYMKATVIQADFFPRQEFFPIDMLIIKDIGFLFTQMSVVLSLSPNLIKLIQAHSSSIFFPHWWHLN